MVQLVKIIYILCYNIYHPNKVCSCLCCGSTNLITLLTGPVDRVEKEIENILKIEFNFKRIRLAVLINDFYDQTYMKSTFMKTTF